MRTGHLKKKTYINLAKLIRETFMAPTTKRKFVRECIEILKEDNFQCDATAFRKLALEDWTEEDEK